MGRKHSGTKLVPTTKSEQKKKKAEILKRNPKATVLDSKAKKQKELEWIDNEVEHGAAPKAADVNRINKELEKDETHKRKDTGIGDYAFMSVPFLFFGFYGDKLGWRKLIYR